MKLKECYRVAIYLRLSRDDNDIGAVTGVDGQRKNESNSIHSQRELAKSFIRQQENMQLYDIYIDDGYSGVNFDRPEFQRMMRDIQAGQVNCVIVKDLSRLGRDYIEAGRLIQKTFPAFCVRFIAITDHFDSLTADNNEKSLVIPVKNFVNDSYCRDISQKVKSHQKIKRENGEFIGAFAVYGYRKGIGREKNKLIPDDYAAGIVRNIYSWKIEGMSTLAIAERLNELGILSPMEYKRFHGEKYATSFQTGMRAVWSAVAVKRILVNEVYIGTLVQGKEEKVNYKIKKSVKKPENEWIRVEQTHKPIISKEEFELANLLLKTDIRAERGTNQSHLFVGFLYCGDCKETMVRRVNRYKGKTKVYYICQTRNKGAGCTRHSIEETRLSDIVWNSVKTYASLFIEKSEQIAFLEQKNNSFDEVVTFDKEIKQLRKEQEKYLILRSGLYEDFKEGLITKEDVRNFGSIYKRQFEEIEKVLQKQEELLKQLFELRISAEIQIKKFKNTMKITEFSRNVLVAFIDRIDVFEHQRVEITFRFQEQFSKMREVF